MQRIILYRVRQDEVGNEIKKEKALQIIYIAVIIL